MLGTHYIDDQKMAQANLPILSCQNIHHSHRQNTVNTQIFTRILFLPIALKDILATKKS